MPIGIQSVEWKFPNGNRVQECTDFVGISEQNKEVNNTTNKRKDRECASCGTKIVGFPQHNNTIVNEVGDVVSSLFPTLCISCGGEKYEKCIICNMIRGDMSISEWDRHLESC